MRQKTRALAIASTLLGLAPLATAETPKSETPKGERALQQVYFDFDSATLTADLLPVANQLECTPKETIILDAHTDLVGPEDYNADLAMRRAQAVRARLVAHGIDANRIMLSSFGERGERSTSRTLDRRVEIRTSDEPVATIMERRKTLAVAVLQPGQVEAVARP